MIIKRNSKQRNLLLKPIKKLSQKTKSINIFKYFELIIKYFLNLWNKELFKNKYNKIFNRNVVEMNSDSSDVE